MIPLRPYQVEAVERVRDRIRAGARRILLVLATGGGKTVVASNIVASARAKSKRTLFVAHRRELIRQTFAKLVRNGLHPDDVGIVMAGVESRPADLFADETLPARDDELWSKLARRRPHAPVQIASVDTLRNRERPGADLVIVDEAHRALAPSYVKIRDAYPKATHLGLTATPYRADGRGLGETYEELVVVASPSLLISEGFLVAPRVFTVPAGKLPDLGSVRVRGGDYDAEELARAVDQAKLVGDIVEHWQRHAPGVRTVAFAASVEHSRHIAARFVEAGVPAEHLDGETPAEERDAILRRLERGETLVVSNCGVLCEGWDQPSVKACILARPTKSTGLYLQQAGRILRPYQGQPAVILDHAGCAVEHGLPQDDREFTLDARPKKKRAASDLPPAKTCEQCYAVVPTATRVCPECGFEWPAPEREPIAEEAGQLVEVAPATPEEKRAFWDGLVATRGGRKPGWVFHRFVERFGTRPPSSWKVPESDADRMADGEDVQAEAWRTYVAEARARGHKPSAPRFRFRARFGRFPTEAQAAAWESAATPSTPPAPFTPDPDFDDEPAPASAPRPVAPPPDEELIPWAI